MDGSGASTGKVAVGQALRQRAPPDCTRLEHARLEHAVPVVRPAVLPRPTRLSSAARAVAHGAGRAVEAGVILLGAVVMVVLAGVLMLAWRLGQGPLDLDWMVERLLAARDRSISVGHAELEWRGFTAGPGTAIELRVTSVRMGDAAAKGVAATLSLAGLLHGELAPGNVRLAHVSLALVRDEDGVRLTGTPPAAGTGLAQALPGLAPPPQGQSAVPGLHGLERLRDVQVDAADVTLDDKLLGTTAHLALGAIAAQREAKGGVHGAAAGTLAVAGVEARFSVEATLAQDGGTRLSLAMQPVALAGLHGVAPALDALKAVQLPIGGAATLLLSPALLPTGATLHLQAGSGTVGIKDKVIPVERAAGDAELSWAVPDGGAPAWTPTAWTLPARLVVRDAVVVVRAPQGPVTATGDLDATRTKAGVTASLGLAVDRVAFADLPGLWPAGVSKDVRPWLTENVTAGIARDATIRMGLTAAADFSGVRVSTIDGRLAGDDLTVHWLRPVPPMEHGSAVLTIQSSPQVLDIDVPSARQGGLLLRHGHVHITGLDVKDQFMALGLDVEGSVPELLALLRTKRLDLLAKHPLPMRNPAGSFTGHLGIDFPLNHDLRFDQLAIRTQAHMQGLHLGGLVAGRDLDGGDVTLAASTEGLKAQGRAHVAGIPSQLAVSMDFRDGPPAQVVVGGELTTRATAQQLAGAGLDPGGTITGGTLAVTARYEERRDGRAQLKATADAQDAGLAVAGWRKAPGPAAHASATVLVDHGKVTGIEPVQADGPGLELDGKVRTVEGRPLDLVLNRIVLGGTRATGEVRFPDMPGGAVRLQLSGPVLDLSTQFGPPARPGSGPPTELKDNRGTPFVADVRFDRVMLAHGSTVSGAAGHVEDDGRRITALHIVTGAPEYVVADIRPDGTGRRLTVRAADGGAALRALDVTEAVRGGALTADARYDDTRAVPVLSGQATLTGFHMSAAVVAGKVLQALTVYGVPEALSGPGVLFDRLVLPFRWDGTRLDVVGAQAFSASLGLTAEGSVDRARGQIDLHGTVVPVYLLNSLLGRLPLVGKLFSPEAGSGLVAMDWTLRGPVAGPTVRANPLSLLTPGILRRLFRIFDRGGP